MRIVCEQIKSKLAPICHELKVLYLKNIFLLICNGKNK